MMTPDKAAQYLIVGWVKDWNLQMYLFVVSEQHHGTGRCVIDFNDAHRHYPWLPAAGWVFAKKISVRRYLADNFSVLSNRLWDAADHAARLKLATQVSQLDGSKAGIHVPRSMRLAASSVRYAGVKLDKRKLEVRLTQEHYSKGGGHDWKTCK